MLVLIPCNSLPMQQCGKAVPTSIALSLKDIQRFVGLGEGKNDRVVNLLKSRTDSRVI